MNQNNRYWKILMLLLVCHLAFSAGVHAQQLSSRYNEDRPLVVVCDWDKAPYEFRNDRGEPDGSNIDLLRRIAKELDIHVKFVLKEWTTALKTFERHEADIILANIRRYRSSGKYAYTENIINYNRICVATAGKSSGVVNRDELFRSNVVLKYGDYVSFFFLNNDSTTKTNVEYQAPTVALQGLTDGDYKYFVWGEEPMKWKIKELGLQNDITLNDVDIPVSEIHIFGHDKELIYQIDDCYSRLKQSGEVQRINDRWLHPERVQESSPAWIVYAVIVFLLLIAIIYGFMVLAKAHVRSATRNSRELNGMMYKALRMGNIHVMEYDIKANRMMNRYGKPMLPDKGVTLEEFAAHIHPNEVEEFRQKMQTLLSGRERKFELKKRWRSFADNQWHSLEGHAIVELDSEGRPAYVINAVGDITQNVEQDRNARELLQKYDKLANMPFIAMSFYDKEGRLINLNDHMREMCGISPNNPEAQRYWLNVNMFDTQLFRGIYSSSYRHQLLACIHMDYPEMNIDRYVEVDLRPLLDEHGEVANYFCSTRDVTEMRNMDHHMHTLNRELKQLQESIDRYERWLNFLTTQGNTFLWYSDIDKRTAYYYRSLKSREPGDFVVLPFDTHLEYMPESERTEAEANLCNRDPNKKFDYVHHFRDTVLDGGESWFHLMGTPVIDSEGRVTGHRGQSFDITQEMRANKKLAKERQVAKDIVRLKSSFMASMTHELRTPLNAIIGFTDVLGSITTPGEAEEYMKIIYHNCELLHRLINDILEASSFYDGPLSINQSDIDFAEAFDELCLSLQRRVPEGVVFKKENPYNSFYTKLDMGRISQVINNFFDNAVKFTKQGYIRLSYQYQGGGLNIRCEDSGVGIPKDKQMLIFNRFVKLDEFAQGTGMGLSICKTIIERLGGNIGVSSEGPGTGSTFWVWIPCERKLTMQMPQ